MDRPRVSVLLPFYNAADTLERACRSIAAQQPPGTCTTNDWFECILVDNASTDKGGRIAQRWATNDCRFKVIHEHRRGVVHAANAGIREATGEYIARMDADDVAYPQRMALQTGFLDRHREFGAVGGRAEYKSDHNDAEGFRQYVEWSNSLRTFNDIRRNRFIESPVINPTSMWRRELNTSYGLFRSGDFPEDYEWWLRLLSNNVKIVKVKEYVLGWYDSPARLTRAHPDYTMKAFYRIKTRYLAQWLQHHNPYHPFVAIWGGSRIARRRARMLESYGIRIKSYIDLRRRHDLRIPVIQYSEIPSQPRMFIVAYVNHPQGRAQIREFLDQCGYVEEDDFLIAA